MNGLMSIPFFEVDVNLLICHAKNVFRSINFLILYNELHILLITSVFVLKIITHLELTK